MALNPSIINMCAWHLHWTNQIYQTFTSTLPYSLLLLLLLVFIFAHTFGWGVILPVHLPFDIFDLVCHTSCFAERVLHNRKQKSLLFRCSIESWIWCRMHYVDFQAHKFYQMSQFNQIYECRNWKSNTLKWLWMWEQTLAKIKIRAILLIVLALWSRIWSGFVVFVFFICCIANYCKFELI